MILLLTIVLALLTNELLLFYDLGIGFFLLMSAYTLYLTYNLYRNKSINRQTILKIGVTLCILVQYILRDMEVFKIITLLLLPIWLAVFSVEVDDERLLTQWKPILISLFRPFAHFHRFIKDSIDKLFKGRESLKYVFIGVLVALPVLLVVIPLLIQADMIFKDASQRFFEQIEITSEVIFRIIFCLIVASYAYAVAILQFIKKKEYEENGLQIPGLSSKGAGIAVTTMLVLINVIYSMFVYIQIRYLFLNAGALPDGITYATYAREGFFQLLTVAILNVILVSVLEWLNKNRHTLQRILEGLTLICTFVMGVSSFYRMHLYEVSYGYTRLRLLVFMFLIFLLVFIMMLLGYLISYKKVWLHTVIYFSVAYYIGASWFNVDGFIVRENIARYEKSGEFDAAYAMTLSSDAIPLLVEFYKIHPEALDPNEAYDPDDNSNSYSVYESQTFTWWLQVQEDKIKNQPWQSYNLAQWFSKQK